MDLMYVPLCVKDGVWKIDLFYYEDENIFQKYPIIAIIKQNCNMN